MSKNSFFLFIALAVVSCSRHSADVEWALKLAGRNRIELEKVLEYYAKNPADSLKYKAAVFLIENMPGHYSYKNPNVLQSYYDELCLGVSPDYDKDANRQIIEQISRKYNSNMIAETVQDVQFLTAEYLIDNIERAFAVWEEGEWAMHVSFDDFCEYILPYKTSELQPIDNWREYAKDMFEGDIELLHYCDLYKNSAFRAATSVSMEIIKIIRQDYPQGGINAIPIMDIKTIAQMPFGSCDDYTFLALPVMRSKGIPVMEDFTPQWPFQPQSHSWNIVLNNDGKNMVFSAGSSNPGELHKPDEKMAKVFRKTYAMNKEIFNIHESERFVPNTFKDLFLKDVTREYMIADDVEIEIPVSFRNKYVYAYLAVFDNKNWISVQYGKIKGKKVRFTAMGRNCMYLPVFYDENEVIPFSSPFYITPLGKIKRYETDKTQTTTMNVYRKYFIGSHCYAVGDRMQGGVFEAANRSDFEDAVIIYKIPDFTVQSGMVLTDTINTPYRYWRYRGPDYSFCNVGELYFYKQRNEKPIYGNIIGTESFEGNEKEVAFDGDPLTLFNSNQNMGGWVGMDFGEPVKINHISYTPRGDGNDVTPGDVHELLYWCENQWKSTGKCVATDIVLVYENIPVNTVYLLRNLSRGKDERIFTYEDGKQIWW